MVYISKLTRGQSRAIDQTLGSEHAKKNQQLPKIDPIYGEMQKETDKLKWRHRRELKLNM